MSFIKIPASEHESIIREYNSGKSMNKIAESRGVSRECIRLILNNNGVEIYTKIKIRQITKSDIEKIKKLRAEGKNIEETLVGISVWPSMHNYKLFREAVKKIPQYGSINNRKCTACGFIGDKKHFVKHNNPAHLVLYCTECWNKYQRERMKYRRSTDDEYRIRKNKYQREYRKNHRKATA